MYYSNLCNYNASILCTFHRCNYIYEHSSGEFASYYIMSRVFANGPGDLGSIPGCVIPETLKMVLDTSLLNTQQYKVYIKGKVE